MSVGRDRSIVARRIGAAGIDWSIELCGGVLGSYFGIMVAALLTAIQDDPAVVIQSSIWHGLGFGFIFGPSLFHSSIAFSFRVFLEHRLEKNFSN